MIVGGEGGRGKFLGGFARGTLRAPVLSMFSSQTMKGFVAKENAADLVVLKDLIEAGQVNPLIDRTFSLVDVPQAMRYLREGSGRKGKIVVTVSSRCGIGGVSTDSATGQGSTDGGAQAGVQ